MKSPLSYPMRISKRFADDGEAELGRIEEHGDALLRGDGGQHRDSPQDFASSCVGSGATRNR